MKASLRRNITWSIVTGILGVGCILGYTMYQRERSKGENLETQLAQLSKKERQLVSLVNLEKSDTIK